MNIFFLCKAGVKGVLLLKGQGSDWMTVSYFSIGREPQLTALFLLVPASDGVNTVTGMASKHYGKNGE